MMSTSSTRIGNSSTGPDSATSAPTRPKTSIQAIVAVVFGIIALLFFWSWAVVVPASMLAIVLAVRARRESAARRDRGSGRAVARAGLTFGVASLVLFAVMLGVAAVDRLV
jgi:hypothetical protein